METIMPKVTVAFVEDSPIPRMVLERAIMQRNDMELRYIAESGEQLLYLLQNAMHLPQVCILDLHMETMNGSEVARKLRKIYPSLLMIGFTSSANQTELEEMLESGMKIIFPKDLAGMTDMLSWIRNWYDNIARK